MTREMDSTSDDHSPPLSDNAGSTWLNWENEISSISGLNIDSTTELNGLVEDKEVAARAVAFVVNSTRKGIVPLCADVANLLRAKRSLEKKVYLLKREVEALRSSTSVSFRTSHSTSPTAPLADKSHNVENVGLQERSRPCSRCSQCSSTVSNSPKLDSQYNLKSFLPSPAVSRDALRRTSPRLSRQPPKLPVGGSVSSTNDVAVSTCSQTSKNTCEHVHLDRRKNSLPEMTSEPDVEVKRISPKISKETQCCLPMRGDSAIEEQFIETVRLNSKLAEELGSARKEIEVLKGRLKELEMNQLARECTQEQYRPVSDFEETTFRGSRDDSPAIAPDPLFRSSNGNNCHRRLKANGFSPVKSSASRVPGQSGSLLYAEPLYGCKCIACEEAMGGEIHAALSASLNEDLQKFPINSKVLVQLGDHVVTNGEKTGRIRYIGHLDKIGQPNMVFVGLELDAPVGRHDGFFNKKRYFFCQKDHGIFLPLHDIICKVHSKAVSCSDDRQEPLTSNMEDFISGVEMATSSQGSDLREQILLQHSNMNNAEPLRSAEDLV
ncbi:uncharacterized protein LOC101853550 [Aplysia californica]|uniref:Uncharacterized protein LOC101853550 n=1 Tax=Aplysia californica TaxID=6500 RepID=A0ABM0JN23_APLCA|nr:uncharacterized protein LOC101853550 [Aplysia californica]